MCTQSPQVIDGFKTVAKTQELKVPPSYMQVAWEIASVEGVCVCACVCVWVCGCYCVVVCRCEGVGVWRGKQWEVHTVPIPHQLHAQQVS